MKPQHDPEAVALLKQKVADDWVNSAPRTVKEWRSQHNFTIKKLAEILGVHFETVKKWESGENPPPIYLAFALIFLRQHIAPTVH